MKTKYAFIIVTILLSFAVIMNSRLEFKSAKTLSLQNSNFTFELTSNLVHKTLGRGVRCTVYGPAHEIVFESDFHIKNLDNLAAHELASLSFGEKCDAVAVENGIRIKIDENNFVVTVIPQGR